MPTCKAKPSPEKLEELLRRSAKHQAVLELFEERHRLRVLNEKAKLWANIDRPNPAR